ncbi:MAG: nucleoside 2-deoxyribosyltransferase [Spirochaetales bacterium]|nr:nucleoside 2-deoxyribosyltransferase [Spirochaetales bacterium]
MNIKYKPDFEILEAALCGEKPERIPLAEMTVDKGKKAEYLGRAVRTPADEVAFWKSSGHDFVPFNIDLGDMNPKGIKPGEGERTDKEGVLADGRAWASEGTGVITSLEQLEGHPFPSPDDIASEEFSGLISELEPGMKIVLTTGHIFTDTWRLMGFDTFAMALLENFDFVQAVTDRIGCIILESSERLIENPAVGALKVADDIAYTEGLMVAPEILERLLFPWIKKIADLCRSRNVPFIYHSDGDLSLVFDRLIELGMDAYNPIEPKAMDIRKLKEKYGSKVCLIGNVDLGYTLTRGTPGEVKREVNGLLEDVGRKGAYALSSANSIPHYVPIENFRAMIEAAVTWER